MQSQKRDIIMVHVLLAIIPLLMGIIHSVIATIIVFLNVLVQMLACSSRLHFAEAIYNNEREMWTLKGKSEGLKQAQEIVNEAMKS